MKILHTADVHLQKEKPKTIEAIKLIIELGKKEKIDLMTIGGDFFHKPKDGDELRPLIRELFSNLPFPVLIIPGNHDSKVFKSNLNFGSSLIPLTNEPVHIYKPDIVEEDRKINIVGLPFKDNADDEILTKLKNSVDLNAINLLLIHCTLDIAFSNDDFGDGEKEYFSVSKATLKELGYNYILAGHFHSRFDQRNLSNTCQFVYPGSPVSLNRKEIGERYIALVDTERGTVSSIPLEGTFTRELLNVKILPGNEKEIIEEFLKKSKLFENKNGELLLSVEGYGEIEEKEMAKILSDISKDNENVIVVKDNYITVKEILKLPLYERFVEKLKERKDIDKEKVQQMALEAMRKMIWEKEK